MELHCWRPGYCFSVAARAVSLLTAGSPASRAAHTRHPNAQTPTTNTQMTHCDATLCTARHKAYHGPEATSTGAHFCEGLNKQVAQTVTTQYCLKPVTVRQPAHQFINQLVHQVTRAVDERYQQLLGISPQDKNIQNT